MIVGSWERQMSTARSQACLGREERNGHWVSLTGFNGRVPDTAGGGCAHGPWRRAREQEQVAGSMLKPFYCDIFSFSSEKQVWGK